MTQAEIDKAVREVLNNKELIKKSNINKRDIYDLRNEDKRMVHPRRKLYLLWQAGRLELK